ncbi:MAG TPA: hypothetical protein VFM55_00665 [Micromonosporaceae bacterium]|nr:hypothetical protein [Micromonosporaceae bacterium]
MQVGTQFTGTVPAGAAKRWFTHSWNPAHHVVWTVVPVTPGPGAAQIEWEVEVQRASATAVTYWLTVRNLSAASVDVEGRYAVLS